MLKLLVRLASFGVAVFLAVLAGLFLASEEAGFPWDTDFTARLDFSQSPVPKDQVVAELNGLAESGDLRLAKVVADPANFLTSQSLYVFGSAAPKRPIENSWFRSGMTGELRAADTLRDASLDGTYVYSGSSAAVANMTRWFADSGVRANTQERTVPTVLANALISTGAWLPFLTCLVLVVSMTVSWYVLRARARTVKVLNGARSIKILLDDLLSLLAVSSPPILAGLLLALGFVWFSGKGVFVVAFGLAIAAFLAFLLGVMLVSAILISAFTWPTVAGIASRLAPERHYRLVGEALKAATLILVAISLPAAGSAIAVATHLSDQGARWESLAGQVSVRIGTSTLEEFDSQMENMDSLVQAADEAGSLTFSYAMNIRSNPQLESAGYDGLVMVNRSYLKRIAPFMGFSVSPDRPLGNQGQAISHDRLSPALAKSLSSSYELWNRAGRNLDGFEKNFITYRYTGSKTFPGLAPSPGQMENFRNPVVVVVSNPSSTFNRDFLSSTLSSGNQMFSDSKWLRTYLSQSPLREDVLSIDRVSDSGLYNSQQENQTASVRMLSYALVILALVASVAVSAWIYALARGRRLFAQRTSGWTWKRVLAGRMLWETSLATAVTGLLLAGSQSSSEPGKWWVLAAIPLYTTVSAGLHLVAVRKVFSLRLARSE